MHAMEQMPPSQPKESGPKGKKPGRRLTKRALRNQALHYLARYAASRWRVERFLRRRLDRAAAEGRADIGREEIAPLLDDLARLGLIDDQAFAETKARSLARRGLSARAIAARLGEQGIEAEAAQLAIAALDADLGNEEARAWHYCKKRRLGPYRAGAERAERRQRDLAALGRRGFSYDIARRVIDAACPPDRENPHPSDRADQVALPEDDHHFD